MKLQEKCNICSNKAYARGICLAHYLATRRLIARGLTTWEELEKRGVSNPLRRTQGPTTDILSRVAERHTRT